MNKSDLIKNISSNIRNIKKNDTEEAKKKFYISDKTKNIICGISASGPTKRWDVSNYIK